MFVVIPPAKKLLETDDFAVKSTSESSGAMKLHFKGTDIETTTPCLINDSRQLHKLLIKLSQADLIKLMKISPKLAELNYQRYRDLFTGKKYCSAFLFQGDTYQGLRADTFDADDLQLAQSRLRIISGLYGLLRPLDLINPHRLEVITSLATARGKNLYDFWSDKPGNLLIEQMQEAGVSLVVNAASPAYAKTLFADEKKFEQEGIQIIRPKFCDYNKGTYKVIGLFAKKARGSIARYIIQQKIEQASDLAHFNLDGYEFVASESTVGNPVFHRRNLKAA